VIRWFYPDDRYDNAFLVYQSLLDNRPKGYVYSAVHEAAKYNDVRPI